MHLALDMRWSVCSDLPLFTEHVLPTAARFAAAEDLPLLASSCSALKIVDTLLSEDVFVWLTTSGLGACMRW